MIQTPKARANTSSIRNVTAPGTTGTIGQEIVKALLPWKQEAPISLSQLSDNDNNEVDYEFPASLTQALADQHAIVEAFNPSATIHQERIVRAALAAPSVQRLITPDFSSDTFHPHANGSTAYWTALITGPFFDWGIA
ncbi:uncharacterized protein BO95DRAFT_510539 [Aspergillus brunneoviolaceus CBS 621.78]|uniref:Uncharacterized protein n=1 Tax=Aspergillus brunneoviolaceus CBS 621.78 TaxID=1450534 RepID=A0ACD1GME3_9EURO|nr:hypothetical protein BO95DRAFT_510539 [Aspergillus brunneoviolaceus CBS 621.78]RAH50443.1 hypothetical protein BO95DRAFT_510539 [Aspergillus brunneoviolaceus CBS 621.78]